MSEFPCYLPSFGVYDAFISFFLCLDYTYLMFSFWMPIIAMSYRCPVWVHLTVVASKYFFSFYSQQKGFTTITGKCLVKTFKYSSTFPKTFCRSVSYKYWHIQAMHSPTEQVEDHSEINFSVLLFQRKWISPSSAFQCLPAQNWQEVMRGV